MQKWAHRTVVDLLESTVCKDGDCPRLTAYVDGEHVSDWGVANAMVSLWWSDGHTEPLVLTTASHEPTRLYRRALTRSLFDTLLIADAAHLGVSVSDSEVALAAREAASRTRYLGSADHEELAELANGAPVLTDPNDPRVLTMLREVLTRRAVIQHLVSGSGSSDSTLRSWFRTAVDRHVITFSGGEAMTADELVTGL